MGPLYCECLISMQTAASAEHHMRKTKGGAAGYNCSNKHDSTSDDGNEIDQMMMNPDVGLCLEKVHLQPHTSWQSYINRHDDA